jgi:hypothetical protein
MFARQARWWYPLHGTMARVGERYCWLIADDPAACPYLGPGEIHLLSDVRRRNREKCLGCEELRRDLAELREHG